MGLLNCGFQKQLKKRADGQFILMFILHKLRYITSLQTFKKYDIETSLLGRMHFADNFN